MSMLEAGGIEMMIVMQEGATQREVEHVLERLGEAGARGHVSTSDVVTVIGVIGDREVIAGIPLEAFVGVDKVLPILKPYKLVSREFRRSDTVIEVGGNKIGGSHVALIAGPCSVESREQLLSSARYVKQSGATMLRGGAYKPRTSPYAFQGLGLEALQILAEARDETGLPVVTELMDQRHLEAVVEYADVIQIGARNMQNFYLLSAVGEVDRPILLKRGLSATIDELLMAAEYIANAGNTQVILCERGIRTFETATRNTLDLSAVPVIKQRSHLPVVVDPSHATGKVDLVEPLSLAALAAGADGLLIESHPAPEAALCDGGQSLNPKEFARTAARLRELAAWLGKSIG
ncbi:MAG TPA: 3-deoxy-7-phosphoheptulonate synthase [Thermoleophilia bacterium]|nr:3-deoxy-7-phosphoheptulonate synthase [Thermoleophilia bacterium]